MRQDINRWKECGPQMCQTAFKLLFLSFLLGNRRNSWKGALLWGWGKGGRGGGGRGKEAEPLFFFWKYKLKKILLKCITSRKGIFSFWFCKKDLSMREQVESYSESCLLMGNRAYIPDTIRTVTWTGCWRAANTMGWRVLQQLLSHSSVTWCQLLISSFSRSNFSFYSLCWVWVMQCIQLI